MPQLPQRQCCRGRTEEEIVARESQHGFFIMMLGRCAKMWCANVHTWISYQALLMLTCDFFSRMITLSSHAHLGLSYVILFFSTNSFVTIVSVEETLAAGENIRGKWLHMPVSNFYICCVVNIHETFIGVYDEWIICEEVFFLLPFSILSFPYGPKKSVLANGHDQNFIGMPFHKNRLKSV